MGTAELLDMRPGVCAVLSVQHTTRFCWHMRSPMLLTVPPCGSVHRFPYGQPLRTTRLHGPSASSVPWDDVPPLTPSMFLASVSVTMSRFIPAFFLP